MKSNFNNLFVLRENIDGSRIEELSQDKNEANIRQPSNKSATHAKNISNTQENLNRTVYAKKLNNTPENLSRIRNVVYIQKKTNTQLLSPNNTQLLNPSYGTYVSESTELSFLFCFSHTVSRKYFDFK